MPSSVQPTHAPQNPVICSRESLVCIARGGEVTASLAMASSFAGKGVRETHDLIFGYGDWNSQHTEMTRTASTRPRSTEVCCRRREHSKAFKAARYALLSDAARGLKERRHRGLHYLAHRIARKRIQHEKPRGQFIRG